MTINSSFEFKTGLSRNRFVLQFQIWIFFFCLFHASTDNMTMILFYYSLALIIERWRRRMRDLAFCHLSIKRETRWSDVKKDSVTCYCLLLIRQRNCKDSEGSALVVRPYHCISNPEDKAVIFWLFFFFLFSIILYWYFYCSVYNTVSEGLCWSLPWVFLYSVQFAFYLYVYVFFFI